MIEIFVPVINYKDGSTFMKYCYDSEEIANNIKDAISEELKKEPDKTIVSCVVKTFIQKN